LTCRDSLLSVRICQERGCSDKTSTIPDDPKVKLPSTNLHFRPFCRVKFSFSILHCLKACLPSSPASHRTEEYLPFRVMNPRPMSIVLKSQSSASIMDPIDTTRKARQAECSTPKVWHGRWGPLLILLKQLIGLIAHRH